MAARDEITDIARQITDIAYQTADIAYQITDIAYQITDIAYQITDIARQIRTVNGGSTQRMPQPNPKLPTARITGPAWA